MKAKVVFHNGNHFRSLTEARWAVFFEDLHVPYEYEKEVFHLTDDLFYLPDFWLPLQKAWLEIKGEPPNEEERYKAIKLHELTKLPVYIFSGFPDVMQFSDLLGTDAHFPEICNFGTYVVDNANPDKCIPFRSKSANLTVMQVLNCYSPDMNVHEFRVLTDRFNQAALHGRGTTFYWIERPENWK